MLHTAALPFVLHREHGVISGRHSPGGQEITSTRDHLHGLLYLDGERLVVQWRTSREVSRVGREIRTDRELTAVREVALPLDALADAAVRRVWRGWRFGEALVLTASDLRAFDALTGEGSLPGLLLEHPAEVVLDVRRTDRQQARRFVSELRLALSERLVAVSEQRLQALGEPEGERLPMGNDEAMEEDGVDGEVDPARRARTRA